MKLSNAKQIIKEIYKTESVTALISERGVGKTSIYKQCTEEMGIGYIDLYAAALEGPDFMGLPDKDKNKGVTTYLAPSFLPTTESVKNGIHKKKGIIVLEEINRVSPDTISVLYPLLLDRKLNGHILADGWKLGVTMNPDSLNYMVNTLDDAIIDRFISIFIEPNIDDYLEYSKLHNPNNDVLEYLRVYPEMLLIIKKNSLATQKAPTPRGWTKVQEILNICLLNDDILQETLTGIIGAEASASFIGFKNNKNVKLPTADELLENFKSIKSVIISLIEKRQFDHLSLLIKSIVLKIDNYDTNSIYNLNQFLNILPQELQVLFYKELSLNNEELLSDISENLDSFDKLSDIIIDLMVN